MTYLQVISDKQNMVSDAAVVGPMIGVDLPDALAERLAAGRQILVIEAKALPDFALQSLEDAVVGCLLLGQPTDALDVIDMLTTAGYRGAVMVAAPPLPNPDMVLRELKRAGRKLSVTMVEL